MKETIVKVLQNDESPMPVPAEHISEIQNDLNYVVIIKEGVRRSEKKETYN